MALRTELDTLVRMVRDECRLESRANRGIDHRNHVVQLLQRHYVQLAEDYDWAHLRITHEHDASRVVMENGTRFYSFPTALNLTKITRAWVRWGSSWSPIEYGIGYEHYSAYNADPALLQKADPVQRWDYQANDAGDPKFEVWPTPASTGANTQGYAVAFDGQKKITPLDQPTSRCDIDDLLLVLFVSSEILMANKQKEAAEAKSAAARARMDNITGRLASKRRFRMGAGEVAGDSGMPRHPRYVR